MVPDGDEAGSERRKVIPRRRVLKGARIVFNKNQSTLTCTIRNLTQAGALVILPSILGVPDRFDLLIGDEPPLPCRVIHKHDGQIGVSFD